MIYSSNILAKTCIFGRNSLFWPKIMFWPKFLFGQNFGFYGGACFGFGPSAEILFRLPTSLHVGRGVLGLGHDQALRHLVPRDGDGGGGEEDGLEGAELTDGRRRRQRGQARGVRLQLKVVKLKSVFL